MSTGKHLVFTTDPESVKDEFAFDNPGFRQEERTAWQHEAPTLPLGGKHHGLHVEFTKPEHSKDDSHLQVRHFTEEYTVLSYIEWKSGRFIVIKSETNREILRDQRVITMMQNSKVNN